MPGKADWLAFGLPAERENSTARFVGEVLSEIPTCRLRDSIASIEPAIHESATGMCAVVSERGVVLGVCEAAGLRRDATLLAEDVMEPGPTTLRPSHSSDQAAEKLRDSGKRAILVTSSDGKLLGGFTLPRKHGSPG
jgi:CBS domain-containing protein